MQLGEGGMPGEGQPQPGSTPSDPANVGAQSLGPGLSSFEEDDEAAAVFDAPDDDFDETPDHPTEPQRATHEAQGAGTEAPAPIPELPADVIEDFERLMTLGRLSDDFEWMGHLFVIETMPIDFILEIGLITKPFVGTLSELKAYQTAVVAACTKTVDGRPVAIPLNADAGSNEELRDRFVAVRRWYSPTIDYVYEQYLLLEDRVEKVMAAVGKARGWTVSIPMSSGVSG
jgi:hypothetical protein